VCANGLSAPARRALIKLGVKLVQSPDCNSQAGALGALSSQNLRSVLP
jgi:hypothetical protein